MLLARQLARKVARDLTDQNTPHSNPNERPGRPVAAIRKGPALIVLGLALAIMLGGAGLALAFGGSHHSTRSSSTSDAATACVPQSGIPTTSAASLLRSLGPSGEIPRDVMTALFVPAGAQVTAMHNYDHSAGQFDRELVLRTPGARRSLTSCYEHGLVNLGWKLTSTPLRKSQTTQILAQYASRDGYYWEVGVTIAEHSSAVSKPNTRPSSLTLRLLEMPDAS